MFTNEKDFLFAAAKFGLVLDANLLIVYITGCFSPEKIGHTSTTEGYSREDYEMIRHYMDRSLGKKIITTPYVISEVVHLLNIEPSRTKRNGEMKRPDLFDKTIDVLAGVDEFKNTSVSDMEKRHTRAVLLRLGVPDVSLVEATNKKSAFLSSDMRLCDEMTAMGIPALHYSRAKVFYKDLNLANILNR